MIIYGISHIDVPVRDLDRAQKFYVEVLGFVSCERTDAWVDVEAGTVKLRLTQSGVPGPTVTIRLQCGQVEEARERLLHAGAKPVSEVERTPELELVTVVADPDEHRLILWRPLTEDEYGFDPELPTEKVWTPEAEARLKAILRTVPVLFRALARKRITKTSEIMSGDEVDAHIVVRASILSTAKIMRKLMRAPLSDLGIDLERYQEDFDA